MRVTLDAAGGTRAGVGAVTLGKHVEWSAAARWQRRRRAGHQSARQAIRLPAGVRAEAGVAAIGADEADTRAAVVLILILSWTLQVRAVLRALLAICWANAGVQAVACRVSAEGRASVCEGHPCRAGHASAGRLVLQATGPAHAGVAAVGCSERSARAACVLLPVLRLGWLGRPHGAGVLGCLRAGQRRAVGLVLAAAGRASAGVQTIARREHAVSHAPACRQQWRRAGHARAPGLVAQAALRAVAGVAAICCREEKTRAAHPLLRLIVTLRRACESGATGVRLQAAQRAGAAVQAVACREGRPGRATICWLGGRRARHQCACGFVLQP